MRAFSRLTSSTLATLCVTASLTAAAQPAPVDPYAAVPVEKLYDEAATEMEAGKFTTACPKLEAVVRMAPEGVGARLTLAECYEGWGKLASAWSQYVAAEAMATKAAQAERAKRAAAKAAELRPRLATLTINVPDALRGAPGLTILRDGTPVSEAQFAAALPADKGAHEIVVSAAGKPTWKTQVDVPADGAQTKVEARFGEEAAKPAVVPTAVPTATPGAVTAAPTTTAPPETPPPATSSSWKLPISIAAIGLGAVGVGIGLELRNQARDAFDTSNRGFCNANDQCDADGLALRNDALGKGNGATAAVIVGSVLAAGGIVLILTDLAGIKTRVAGPKVAVTTNGFLVKGSW